MNYEISDIQLLDYITNHLTDEEQEHVRRWIEKDRVHQEYYEQFYLDYLRQRWYFRKQLVHGKESRKYIIQNKKRYIGWYVISSAVSIMLLLGVFWGYHVSFPGKTDKEVVTVNKDIMPGTSRAKLMTDTEKIISLDEDLFNIIEIDEEQAFVKTPGNIDYRRNDMISSYVPNHLLIVEKGGEYSITLEDSTVVWLNSASTLGYPVAFTGNERRVRLSGEAYFCVKPDKDVPFIVEVGEISVQVTGTEFNINTHKRNQVETVLVEGSVNIIKDSRSYPLKFSQKATYIIDSEEIIVESVDVDKYIAWKNGDIVFIDERLEDIMHKLSLWYDFEVSYAQPEVKDILLSGDMMKYERIENLLYFFENSSGIVFEIKGRTIVVKMREIERKERR